MTQQPVFVRPPLRAGFALYMPGDGLTFLHRRKLSDRPASPLLLIDGQRYPVRKVEIIR